MNPQLTGLKRTAAGQKRALLLFTSHPVKEAARKRIGNSLARGQKVFRAFLRHLIHVAQEARNDVEFDIIIASDSYDAPGMDAACRTLGLKQPLQHITHIGDSFGEKLGSAIRQSFADSYDQLVIVGNDCPDISPQVLARAFCGVSEKGVTIGPAKDGGFYLLGLSNFDPELFSRIRWHSDSVFSSLCSNLRRCGKEIELLPMLGDIDTLHDLQAWISGTPGTAEAALALCLQDLFQVQHTPAKCFAPFIASDHKEMCLWQIPPPALCSAEQAA